MSTTTRKENDIAASRVARLKVMSTGEGGRYYDPANVKEAVLTTVRFGSDEEVLALWKALPRFAGEVWETAFAACCSREEPERIGLLLSVYDPPMKRAVDLMTIAELTGAEGVVAELKKWMERDL